MNTEQLLDIGTRGIHLLFDNETIVEAFQQDADRLRGALEGRFEEVHFAIDGLVKMPDPAAAHEFVQSLPESVRYVIVLLYFELLDGRMREDARVH